MMFENDDWKDFQSLATLCRKAGVAQEKLAMVVAKELTDNALDVAGCCEVGVLDENGFFVDDSGAGIEGEDRVIASLFSPKRPLRSSKRLRRPTRGALGNGLRVVAGAVFSTGGSLFVSTRGRTLHLTPLASGETDFEVIGPFDGEGTRVEVYLGHALKVDHRTLIWANEAIRLAGNGEHYNGKSSAYWFDSDAFYRLLQDAGTSTVRQVIAEFEGCSEPKAGKIAKSFGSGRLASDLGRTEADRLLKAARDFSRPVRPERLGCIGECMDFMSPYKIKRGEFEIKPAAGSFGAVMPYVIEAWAERSRSSKPVVGFSINRTPITVEVQAQHDPKEKKLILFGCGLCHSFNVGRESIDVRNQASITPYMPIVSDGKAPDLTMFLNPLSEVLKSLGKATKSGIFGIKISGRSNLERVVREHLEGSIEKVSGGGQTRYSLRQLYYALRPHLIHALGSEPNYKTFSGIITKVENCNGSDLPGIYRDSRGTLYHPHTGEQIPLGTLNVEQYRRPDWTFNKVLYCEKEGFFPILLAARWAERHDCTLLTSKGFASRAARDMIDLLGESDKTLQVFCIHDADAYGTRIYQALKKATAARPERKVDVVNLGLDPWEALDMGLEVEKVSRKGKKVATVGDYVTDPKWRAWLQDNRVELNAMSTPQFLEWLDAKFEPYGAKVIPPTEILRERIAHEVREHLRVEITDRVLSEEDVAGQIERAFWGREQAILDIMPSLRGEIERHLRANPVDLWADPMRRMALSIAIENGIVRAA